MQSITKEGETIAHSAKNRGDNFTDQRSTGEDKKVLPLDEGPAIIQVDSFRDEDPKERSDIRLEAQNLLTAISEHDRYLSHIEREVVDNCIMVLDHARDRELQAYARASELRDQDIERMKRIGGNLADIPALEDYMIQRGIA